MDYRVKIFLVMSCLIFAFGEIQWERGIAEEVIVEEVCEIEEEEVDITKVSWYGGYFHGRLTASGKIYNKNEVSAASPNLPFGTKVRLTNPDNRKSVVVEITDRGPFRMDSKGRALRPLEPHPVRMFDLSQKAFSLIGDTDKGVIEVEYKIM